MLKRRGDIYRVSTGTFNSLCFSLARTYVKRTCLDSARQKKDVRGRRALAKALYLTPRHAAKRELAPLLLLTVPTLPLRLHVQHFMAHGRSRVVQQGAAAAPPWNQQQPPVAPLAHGGEGGACASVRRGLMLLGLAISVVGGFCVWLHHGELHWSCTPQMYA